MMLETKSKYILQKSPFIWSPDSGTQCSLSLSLSCLFWLFVYFSNTAQRESAHVHKSNPRLSILTFWLFVYFPNTAQRISIFHPRLRLWLLLIWCWRPSPDSGIREPSHIPLLWSIRPSCVVRIGAQVSHKNPENRFLFDDFCTP